MAVVVNSNKDPLAYCVVDTLAQAHFDRVAADGGTVLNKPMVRAWIAEVLSAGLDLSKIMFCGAEECGMKMSGPNVAKLYDLFHAAQDMTPLLNNVTVATHSSRRCLIISDSMLMVATPVVTVESTILIEAKALNVSLRRLGRLDTTATSAGQNNVTGSILVGSTAGHQHFAFSNAGGSDLTYATYADFQKVAYVARQANTSTIYVNGVQVASKGSGNDNTPNYSARYFKLGGASGSAAIHRTLAYAGVLRPSQMKILMSA